jgi:hypothetical protein
MAEIQGRIDGTIGSDDVHLVTNAATEFTLRQLLQATLAIGTKNEKALQELAKSAGYDADAIEKLNQGTQQTGISMGKLEMGARAVEDGFKRFMPYVHMFEGALSKLSDNSGKASEQFKSFEKLGLGIGAIAEKYGKLMAFQEANMTVYQKLTTVGVNLGGSLSDVRNSAGSMYLTLDQFSKVMTENSTAFARMGGTANEGARHFIKIGSELQKSNLGTDLRALGYTAEELNDGLIKYLGSSGTRTKKELENTDLITKSTAEYLTELDKLTQFTGVSKKKLEEDQKKASLNEAYQRKMASLDEKERVKLRAAYDKASASGIEGATDLVMSTALKLPPVTESAKNLQGLAGGVADGFRSMTNSAMTVGTTLEDQQKIYGQTLIAASDQSKQLSITGDYLVASGGKFSSVTNSLIGVENLLRGKGIDSAKGVADEFIKTKKQQSDQQASEAATQAKIQGQMYEASAAVNAAIQALVRDAMPGMTKAITEFTNAVKSMSGIVEKWPWAFNYMYNTLAIIGGAATAIGGVMTAQRIRGIMGNPGGGGIPGGSSSVSTIIDPSTGKPFGAVKSVAAVEAESLLAAGKNASKALKGVAGIGTALTVGFGIKDYFETATKEKEGLISKEEASKTKGGIIGETGGTLAGAAAGGTVGAQVGASIGLLFGGVGAAPGALIGGLLGAAGGAFMGSSLGKSLGEYFGSTSKPKTEENKDITNKISAEEERIKEEQKKKSENPKPTPIEEKLLSGFDRLNSTMDRILTEMKHTAANTEKTAKEVSNSGYLKRA